MESVLLKMYSIVSMALGKERVTLFLIFDLNAAFDTVDPDILLKRHKVSFFMCGIHLKWTLSYVADRTQTEVVKRSKSSKFKLSCGVPQRSVIRPLLFILYTRH